MSMNSNYYIRSPSFLHFISLHMKVAKALGVSTGSSNRKGPKFGGEVPSGPIGCASARK